jgi:lipid-A-disaccharide synthase-like uncharacterized protein
MSAEQLWVGFGLLGQLLFSGRWIVQWFISEKQRRSVVPVVFWYLSLGGGLVLFSYALYRQDPVFILGQAMGSVVYLRNLFLIYRERAAQTG